MAKGDITKEEVYDKIEVVNDYNVEVRKATNIMEEQEDGSKVMLSQSFHRHSLQPFDSYKDDDGKWVHNATDLSGEDAKVKAIAETAWDNDTKTAYKTFRESQTV
tara:strand:- start:1604 stop:1918 length:315 start_codon:yes stop_codon:yes gene_type:complete